MIYNLKEGRLFLLDGGKEGLVGHQLEGRKTACVPGFFDSVGKEDDGSALIWALPRRGRAD